MTDDMQHPPAQQTHADQARVRQSSSWLTRGDGNSVWYFVGATFAFSGATMNFTSGATVLAFILLAVGVVAFVLGILVFGRVFSRPRPSSEPPVEGGPNARGRAEP